jgi:lipopolysaccharide transport system permease protein
MIDEMIAAEPEIRLADYDQAASPPVTVIVPPRGWQLIDFRELWQYRELLMFLTWRDVVVRYKQTILGAAWALLQPALMMVVFTVFLGQMAQVDSGDFPYPVFVYAGLLPWSFFATAIANAGNSVVGSAQMVSKIYFPRLLIPLGAVAAALVDFLIAFSLLIVLMFIYGIRPGFGILLVPMVMALTFMAAVGVGSLLAALNVAYRDFRYTIPFLVQIWMFATPTIYMQVEDREASPTPARAAASGQGTEASALSEVLASPAGSKAGRAGDAAKPRHAGGTSVPGWVKHVLRLNPMTDLIGFFRAAVLGGPLPWTRLATSAAVIAAVLVAGLMYFRRVESSFADVI